MAGTWKTKQGWKKGIVTYEFSIGGGDSGKVNDYTALPEDWKNGKKFETEEPRSYGGTSNWFSSLDAAKRAVETAVEKSAAHWKAYKAKKAVAKDSTRRTLDAAGFQPKQVTCNACGGSGRLSSTGGKCDICGGRGNFVSGGKAPLKLSEPGRPSGWGENYRAANDSSRRTRLHRALDKVMDRSAARDDASLDQVVKAAGFKRVGGNGDSDDWERDRDGVCVTISKTNDEWWAFPSGWDEGGRAGKGAAQLKVRL